LVEVNADILPNEQAALLADLHKDSNSVGDDISKRLGFGQRGDCVVTGPGGRIIGALISNQLHTFSIDLAELQSAVRDFEVRVDLMKDAFEPPAKANRDPFRSGQITASRLEFDVSAGHELIG
jgi:hypothetical protein